MHKPNIFFKDKSSVCEHSSQRYHEYKMLVKYVKRKLTFKSKDIMNIKCSQAHSLMTAAAALTYKKNHKLS